MGSSFFPTVRSTAARWALVAGVAASARCADMGLATGSATEEVPWGLGTTAAWDLTERPAEAPPPLPPCGPCQRACEVGFACVASACTPMSGNAPRLLLPASLGRVTSQRPTFRWLPPMDAEGSRLQVCVDRACLRTVALVETDRPEAQLPDALPAGVYFWRVFPRVNGQYSGKASHTWSFSVRAVSAPVDTSFGRMNDLNGDGFSDVLLNLGPSRPAPVYFGGVDGPSLRPDVVLPAMVDGLTARYGAGGDLNGDGFADLLLTTPGIAGIGALVLLPGGTRLTQERAVVLRSTERWPRSLHSAGDLDQDGYGDLVGVDPEREGAPTRYRVWFGTAQGVNPTPKLLLTAAPGSGLGHAIATTGDLNGDSLPDLLLGAPTHGDGQGRAAVWFNGRCEPGTLLELGAMRDLGGRMGDAVGVAADADGDGFVEALVAAPFTASDFNRSRVHVFPGSADRMADAATTSLALRGAQTEGVRLIPGGDFNGDGYSDLVVWTRAEMRGPSIAIYAGSPAGLEAMTPRVVYPQEFGAVETAISVGLAGDTDRDGFDDLVVFLAPGQVLVARGSRQGLRVGPTPFFTLP